MKIQWYRMPSGLRRAEHAQGCGEWIHFCSCGGLLLLRLEGKGPKEDVIAMCDLRDLTHGVCHGASDYLSIYICIYSHLFVYVLGEQAECQNECIQVFFEHIMIMRRSSGFYHLLLIFEFESLKVCADELSSLLSDHIVLYIAGLRTPVSLL